MFAFMNQDVYHIMLKTNQPALTLAEQVSPNRLSHASSHLGERDTNFTVNTEWLIDVDVC